MEKFNVLTQEELTEIEGGAYDPYKVIQVWGLCYGAGHAVGTAIKNWRK